MAITAGGLAGFSSAIAPYATAQGANNPAQVTPAVQPANITRPPSSVTGTGPYSSFATGGDYGNIPQSFVDEVVQQLNGSNGAVGIGKDGNLTSLDKVGGGDGKIIGAKGTQPTADYFQKVLQQAWSAVSVPEQQRYTAADNTKVTSAKQAAANDAATQQLNAMPGKTADALNQQWNSLVTPAIGAQNAAVQGQKVGDAAAEGQIAQNANAYTGTVNANQQGRVADANQTNALNSSLGSQFGQQVAGANASNTGFVNNTLQNAQSVNAAQQGLVGQMGTAAQGANASNLGYVNQFNSATGSTNQANTGLVNQLNSAVSGANSTQNQNLTGLGNSRNLANSQANSGLSLFQNDIQDSNQNQNINLQNFVQQISQLNGQDRTNYINYLQETNPQMASLIAQQSSAGDVNNQQDVVNQYKTLSNPQATDQERLLATLAQQKFEQGDASSRGAVMQQLAGRGLKSGGLVIANQQQTQQQLGNDRMLAEMGLNANAVGRSMTALQGYGTASNALRNADDAMKQFQDQYAQNDAIRQSQLAQQRSNQGLADTQQIGNRNQAGYNAGTDTTNQNFNRNQAGFNANTDTVSANFGRDQNVYNAATDTNTQNFGRTQGAINTGINTNQTNLGNTGAAVNLGIGTTQTNLGNTNNVLNTGLDTNAKNSDRTVAANQTGIDTNQKNVSNNQLATTTQTGINDTNSTRTQNVLNAGDTTANNVMVAGNLAPTTAIANRGAEVGSAANAAGTGITAMGSASDLIKTANDQQLAAMAKILGFKDVDTMKAALGQN